MPKGIEYGAPEITRPCLQTRATNAKNAKNAKKAEKVVTETGEKLTQILLVFRSSKAEKTKKNA